MNRYFNEVVWTADPAATAQAYAAAPAGGADTCDCLACRNFRIARPKALPAEFLTFLEELGIDFRKDGEAYHCGRTSPGHHCYGGWYHFVGRIEALNEYPTVEFGNGFQASLGRAAAPRLKSLDGAEVVELSFFSQSVPWMLDEPELE